MQSEYPRDLSTGIFILVEPYNEGQYCQVVITHDGHRHIYPEAVELEFEDAVQIAEELRNQMGLQAEHAWMTREAMVAWAGWSLVARRALKRSDQTMIKKGRQ